MLCDVRSAQTSKVQAPISQRVPNIKRSFHCRGKWMPVVPGTAREKKPATTSDFCAQKERERERGPHLHTRARARKLENPEV